jgi:hypothetical protein
MCKHWHIFAFLSMMGTSVMSYDASQIAKEMLTKHGKSTLVGVIMEKCYGSITVNFPDVHQRYGRPASEYLNAETVSIDLQRCGISDKDVADYLKDQAQEEQKLAKLPQGEKRKTSPQSIIGGSSVTVTPPRTPRHGLRPAELAKLQAINARENARPRRQQQSQDAHASLQARERHAAENAKATRDRECAAAKKKRDYYRAQSSKFHLLIDHKRDLLSKWEREHDWVIANCGSRY